MRFTAAAFFLLFAGCEANIEPTELPAPILEVSQKVTEPQAAATIGGRLRAHDGSPLRQAEYHITRDGFVAPVASGPLAVDGSFRVEVEPGIYTLTVSAVDHACIVERLRVVGPTEVEGNLGTYGRPAPGETLALRMEWIGADGQVITAAAGEARRGPTGRYRLDLADRPKDATRLRYQLHSAGMRTFNGPVADRHESDGGADYWSVIELAGRDAIELDLAALPPAGKAEQLRWSGEPPGMDVLRDYRRRWVDRQHDLLRRTPRRDGKIPVSTPELDAEKAARAVEALAEADAAATADLRLLLRLAQLEIFVPFDDDAAAKRHAEWVLEHVDPLEPRLGMFMNISNVLGWVCRLEDEAFGARAEAWFGRMIDNPNPHSAATALSFLASRADARGDQARVTELYAASQAPRFAGSYLAKDFARRFDPARPLQRGKPLPEFEFPALVAGGQPITKAERAGRFYLIEFWATWCGPCVGELPALHAAYAAINGAKVGKGEERLRKLKPLKDPRLEFVFVSFDVDPAEVEAYRAKHWPMPWTHAYVGKHGDEAVMERFGFSGVPTKILVDDTGTIVEYGEALRGDRLLPTLERALANG